MVAEAARRNPTAVAVTYEDRELTYAELDRRADALAHRLQTMGVGPDTIVPVMLDRSEDLVIALLAALKAGGAFMPIDPAQPANRIAAILSNAPGVPVCITHQRHLDIALQGSPVRPCASTRCRHLCLRHAVAASAGTTTGRPGLRHSHIRIHRHAEGRARTPTAESATGCCGCSRPTRSPVDDRVFHQTPVTFDVSVLEIFWPLIAGAAGRHRETRRAQGHRVRSPNASLRSQSPQRFSYRLMLRSFLAQPTVTDCVALRHVSCGGEVVPYELTQRFHATLNAELWNEYGPAEAAVTATYFHCRRGASGPIGSDRAADRQRPHLPSGRASAAGAGRCCRGAVHRRRRRRTRLPQPARRDDREVHARSVRRGRRAS